MVNVLFHDLPSGDNCFLTWYPFPAPFLRKGVKRKVFLTKMVFEGRATTQTKIIFSKNGWQKKSFLKGGPRHKQKMQSLYLFKKWLTKKSFLKQKMQSLCLFKKCEAFFVSKSFFLSTIFWKDTRFRFSGTFPKENLPFLCFC